MAKRRLKIFPIICTLVFIAFVVWAAILLVGIFKNSEADKIDKDALTVEAAENKSGTEISSEPDESIASSTDELPEDETAVIADGAPKPIYSHSELLAMYPKAVLSKTEDAGSDYIRDIIFIGDSTTNGLKHYAILEGGKQTTQVWTPKSGTLAMWNLLTEPIVYPDDESEMLITDAIAVKAPTRVVITLGVNGVSSLSEEQFKDYYQGLIDTVKKQSPYTQIILNSIYPVCDYYQYVNSISMEKINRANTWIAQLASENNIYYLNSISVLVGENGYLKNEYCNGDGIHISEIGFKVILDYIRTHAVH